MLIISRLSLFVLMRMQALVNQMGLTFFNRAFELQQELLF